MPILWLAGASLEGLRRTVALADRQPGRSLVANMEEVDAYDRDAEPPLYLTGSLVNGVPSRDAAPVPRLSIPDAAFDLDFVHPGHTLVSARLRAVLGLGKGDVLYGPVDAGACPEAVRAMDYRTMDVLRFAQPLDPERSDIEHYEETALDGAKGKRSGITTAVLI